MGWIRSISGGVCIRVVWVEDRIFSRDWSYRIYLFSTDNVVLPPSTCLHSGPGIFSLPPNSTLTKKNTRLDSFQNHQPSSPSDWRAVTCRLRAWRPTFAARRGPPRCPGLSIDMPTPSLLQPVLAPSFPNKLLQRMLTSYHPCSLAPPSGRHMVRPRYTNPNTIDWIFFFC